MCDWIDEFLMKFKNDNEIKNLKSEKFYGNITINFFDGNIVDVNKYQTRKPILTK